MNTRLENTKKKSDNVILCVARLNTLNCPIFAAGTKEAAFFSAITSAGIAHAVATACSQDNNSDCTCNETPNSRVDAREKFKWEGCTVHIRYGLKTALEFLREQEIKEADENQRRAINLTHWHNIKAGKQVS